MGWKIGTIALGITTIGFAVLSTFSLIWATELEGKRQVEKAKTQGLETIIDIQGQMLSDKN